MKEIILFLNNNKKLILLLVLISLTLIIRSQRKGLSTIESLNRIKYTIGNIDEFITSIENIPKYKKEISSLIEKQALLLEKVYNLSLRQNTEYDSGNIYSITSGEVIKNSIINSHNTLLIRGGKNKGIKPNMGIFTNDGVVGIVTHVSEKYSKAISLLNTNLYISAKVYNSNITGSLHWDGKNPSEIDLKFIPKHATIQVGQMVITTGYDECLPEGINIGEIIKIENLDSELFYNVRVKLYQDFSTLKTVFLTKNLHKKEITNILNEEL